MYRKFENGITIYVDWLEQSSDANPIENIRVFMKRENVYIT